MFQQSNTSSSNTSDIIADIKNWWETCPLFTRFVIYVCSGLFALSLFSSLAPMLVNQPSKTIGEFQITRLIFSPFCFITIAELLLAFFAYLPMLAGQEKDSGTLAAIVDFFVKNLEINIVFIIVCYFLGSVFPIFKQFQAYGKLLWFQFMLQRLLNRTLEYFLYSFGWTMPPKTWRNHFIILFAIPSEEPNLSFGPSYCFLNHFQHRQIGYFCCYWTRLSPL